MEELKERLAKKGWSQREIENTARILSSAGEKKSTVIRILDEALIWISLFVTVFGNFVLSAVIAPFLLILSGGYLYLVIIVFGIAFGMLFTLLLRSIEKIELERHVMANIFIPVIGLINMYIIARLSNQLIGILQLKTDEHSPALVSMVYMFAFLMPYLVLQYFQEFGVKKVQQSSASS